MLDRTTMKQDDLCFRCGASKKIVAGRVSQAERGYVNFYQCDSCGHISSRDLPQQAPKD